MKANINKQAFHVIQSDWGIGDIICSLYAVQGLAKQEPDSEIHLYLRQYFQWAALADIPQLKIHRYFENKKYENQIILHDDKTDSSKRIKHSNSPKQLYAAKLNVTPAKPAISKLITQSVKPFPEKYIVLSPFASRKNRTWDIQNWRTLASFLAQYGFRVIALDSAFESKRCKEIGVEYFWGQSAEWTAKICSHAELIISNDSGIAHLGGWLGKKTLVLMSQLLPWQFYDLTENHFIVPRQKCTGCRFLPEYGYEEKCNTGCWVLQSLQPEEAFLKAINYINTIEVPILQ